MTENVETATETPPTITQPRRWFKTMLAFVCGAVFITGAQVFLVYQGAYPSSVQSTEIERLKADVAQLLAKPSFNPEAIEGQQAEAFNQINALKTQVEQLKSTQLNPQALASIEKRLLSVENMSKIPTSDTSAVGNDNSALLFQKITELEQKTGQSSGFNALGAAIAAVSLKNAADQGSFVQELAGYARFVPNSPYIEQLRAASVEGITSQKTLLAEFDEAANRMIAASRKPNESTGMFEKITSAAQDLVQIRRVGAVSGNEPDAIISRMELALYGNDLDLLLLEAQKLPQESQTAGKEFLDKVEKRQKVLSVIKKMIEASLAEVKSQT